MSRKALFDIASGNKVNKDETKPKDKKERRRRRTKKPETLYKESSISTELDTEQNNWKLFGVQRPDKLVPCEFYVETGSAKKDIFRGYIEYTGLTCTDEPYKLVVLRKKYGNLYYREIDGCESINKCPKNFPECEKCRLNKK